MAWLIAAGAVLLVLGLAALLFDARRRSGNPFPQILSNLTTQLLRQQGNAGPLSQRSFPATAVGMPSRLYKRVPWARRFVHKLRWGPRVAPLVGVAVLLVACVGGVVLVARGIAGGSQAVDGAVVVIAPFEDSPAQGAPAEAFAQHLLTAAASDSVQNLVVRESRRVVTTPEEAEAERARLNADMLWWGEVGADGSITASLALNPNFAPGQPPWNHLRDTDTSQLAFPSSAELALPATSGTDPMLPLTLALVHMRIGDYSRAAKAAYGAYATLQQSGAGASGQELAIAVEAAGDFARKQFAEAARDFEQARALGDLGPESLITRAVARLAAGDSSGARLDAEQVLATRDAGNAVMARAYLVRARLSLNANDLIPAIGDFDSSLRLDPSLAPAQLDRAEALYRQSQPEKVLAQLQDTIAKDPPAAPAYRLLGLTLLMLARPEEAQNYFNRAEGLYNGWIAGLRADEAKAHATGDSARGQAATDAIVDLNRELAGIYLYEGMAWDDIAHKEPPESFLGGLWRHIRGEPSKWERALDRMQAAQRLDPRRADIPLQMANVYTGMGDTASAAAQLTSAQQLNPAAPEPYMALADLQESQGNHKEAVATLRQLLANNPAYYPAYERLAATYNAAGSATDAANALGQALQVPARTAQDHLWHARFLRTLGDNGGALSEARAAASDPQLWEAHLLLAQLLQASGQSSDALNEFNQALSVQPNNPDALLGAGQLLAQAGQADDAQKLFERLTTLWPSNADGHLAFLELLLAKHDLSRAISEGQKAVAQGQSRADTHFHLALAYEAAQDWPNAASEFEATTQRDPQQFDAFVRWARALYLQDKYRQAIQVCDSALALRSTDPQPHRWKAQAQFALNDLAGAQAAVNNALQLSPHNADILALASRIYTSLGDLANGAGLANMAMQADPRNLGGPLALGDYYLSQGQADAAIKAYGDALSIAPNSAEALTGQGRAYAATGDQVKALQSYQAALAADSKYAPAHLYAGNSYVALGRWNDAFNQYQAAVQLRPDWPDALNELGKAYLQRKDLQNAQAAFNKAVQNAPNMADAWFGLGLASRDKGQAADAIKALGQAVTLDGKDAQAWLYLGLTYEEIGQRSLAADAFTHARDAAQDTSVREQAEKGLARVK